MKKLIQIDHKLNAFTTTFAPSLLDEIKVSYYDEIHSLLTHPRMNQLLFRGGTIKREPFGLKNSEYFLVSYGKAPLFWLSSNTENTYRIYQNFFHSLNVANDIKLLVDCQKEIVMYCGFLVVGNQALNPLWHVDYFPGANAYTLITPLFELDSAHGNLLYESSDAQIKTYQYKLGEAIIFGDHFRHSTEPYNPAQSIRILVSLTFGTDKMEYWNILERTVGHQSNYVKLPCGHVLGTCNCIKEASNSLSKYNLSLK